MTTGNWRDWLPQMMMVWAKQYTRAMNAGRWVKNAQGIDEWHFDGLPLATLLGRITKEGEGAGQGTVNQRFDEVYCGDALVIWRAMEGLPLEPRGVLYARYLSRGGYRDHLKTLGLTKTGYWEAYNEGHSYVSGRVPLIEAQVLTLKVRESGPD